MSTEIENWAAEETGLGGKLSPQTLLAWQIFHIKEQIDYAIANSRFYKEKFVDFSLPLEFSQNDFQKLPFTSAADIAKNPLDFLCIPQNKVERVATLFTSGTSGIAKRIFFSEKDIMSTRKFFSVGMKFMVQKGDSVAIFLPGMGENGVADILKKALSDIGVTAEIFGSAGDIAKAVKEAFGRDCLVGMPCELLRLCRKAPKLRPKTVLLAADYIPRAIVKSIREAWGCEVFSNFGMTEAGMGCAVDCGFHEGMHLRMADIFFEIIDPESGEPKPMGEVGELVFTTLQREAMPLIRYRTGDMASFSTHCGCGTDFPTLKSVYGRREDYALDDGSGIFGMHALEEFLFANPKISDFLAKKGKEGIFLELEAEASLDLEELKSQLKYVFPHETFFSVKSLENFVPQLGKRNIINI